MLLNPLKSMLFLNGNLLISRSLPLGPKEACSADAELLQLRLSWTCSVPKSCMQAPGMQPRLW